MNFSQYYLAITNKLLQHNLHCMASVARDFYNKDYTVDEVVVEFLKYEKKPKFQETILTIKDSAV